MRLHVVRLYLGAVVLWYLYAKCACTHGKEVKYRSMYVTPVVLRGLGGLAKQACPRWTNPIPPAASRAPPPSGPGGASVRPPHKRADLTCSDS